MTYLNSNVIEFLRRPINMLSSNTLNKLSTAALDGHLDLTNQEAADSLIFILSYHSSHKTEFLSDLKSKYGSVPSGQKPVEYYSQMIYPDLMSGDKRTEELFWKLFNGMTKGLKNESLLESLTESVLKH